MLCKGPIGGGTVCPAGTDTPLQIQGFTFFLHKCVRAPLIRGKE